MGYGVLVPFRDCTHGEVRAPGARGPACGDRQTRGCAHEWRSRRNAIGPVDL